MSDDNNITSSAPAKRQRIKLASEKNQEEFTNKMRDIAIKEKEKNVENAAIGAGVSYMNLEKFPIAPEAISMIDKNIAAEIKALCFYFVNKEIRVGAVDPTNPKLLEIIQDLESGGYGQVKLFLISEHSFECGFKLYAAVPEIREVKMGVKIEGEDLEKFKAKFRDIKELAQKIHTISMTDLITFLIATAVDARASDIHIEAEEADVKIRFRIDGILYDIVSLSRETWPKIISRVKLLSRLKLNVTDQPQDGRFEIYSAKDKMDVRVSTIPTQYGESVVMRILMSTAVGISFEALGLRGKAFADLEKEIKRPNGMIITTGPTGSGKTTTLYSILLKLNDPGVKIITLEDPIEYQLKGINQSQVDTGRGQTFATSLRSVVRQDPDIVMVGELRDIETSETAIQASLTGHLVLSTIHTNSAAGTIPRFLSMGVKPFLLAPALNVMIGQRLVRRICEKCKEEVEIDNRTMSEVTKLLSTVTPESGEAHRLKDLDKLKFYHGRGCEECQGLGYRGRIGIYEIMAMNEEIEKLILTGEVSEYQMQEIAVKNGMITMVQDGLLKAIDGLTTVDEVFRVAD